MLVYREGNWSFEIRRLAQGHKTGSDRAGLTPRSPNNLALVSLATGTLRAAGGVRGWKSSDDIHSFKNIRQNTPRRARKKWRCE